jgi:hypothetical protein
LGSFNGAYASAAASDPGAAAYATAAAPHQAPMAPLAGTIDHRNPPIPPHGPYGVTYALMHSAKPWRLNATTLGQPEGSSHSRSGGVYFISVIFLI